MNEMISNFLLFLDLVMLCVIPIIGLTAIAVLFAHKSETGPKNERDARRQEDNLEIIRLLTEYVEANPSQRFGQVLRNTGVIKDIGVKGAHKPEWQTPDYYIDRNLLFEEPNVILERMEKVLANDYDYDIVVKQNKK
jgi:hypothetical protein